jgi:hypothetical protein
MSSAVKTARRADGHSMRVQVCGDVERFIHILLEYSRPCFPSLNNALDTGQCSSTSWPLPPHNPCHKEISRAIDSSLNFALSAPTVLRY